MRFTGRVCVITGAGSGIGRGMAIKFAREGAEIAILDVNENAALETVGLIADHAGTAHFISCDVTNNDQVKAAFDQVSATMSPPTILINSAGIEIMASIEEMTEDAWDRQIDVNVKSMFLCCKYAIPAMRKVGKGSIVNISSVLGIVAAPNHVAYCASKGAVLQFTKALGFDVASAGIRVNCILPGPVDTPLYRKTIAAYGDEKATHEQLVRAVPLRRIGAPEDIANAAVFLSSDEASFITCASLLVDGGSTASNISG